MFLASDTSWAPWYAVHSNDKRKARLNIIRHMLDNIPHDTAPREKVTLPKRQKRDDYVDPEYPFKVIADTTGDAPARPAKAC